MISMYSTVQNAVYNADYGHLKSLELARESKTFRLRGPGLGNQVLGLAIDNETRQPYFCLETYFMPAFQLVMHINVKNYSLYTC